MNQHAFDGCTPLPRIFVGTLYGQIGGLFQISIVHHDQRVVSSELQHHASVPCFAGDVFANRHAACEGDQIDSGMGEHFIRYLAGITGDHLQHLGRQSGLIEQISKVNRRKRHLF